MRFRKPQPRERRILRSVRLKKQLPGGGNAFEPLTKGAGND
jgi:hypothetical protein